MSETDVFGAINNINTTIKLLSERITTLEKLNDLNEKSTNDFAVSISEKIEALEEKYKAIKMVENLLKILEAKQ